MSGQRAVVGLLGVGAALVVGAAAATSSNKRAAQTRPATSGGVTIGVGGGGQVPTPAPKPTPAPTPAPTPKPTPTPTPAPATLIFPPGPSWASEPAAVQIDIQAHAKKLAAFLVVVNPKAWALSPIARQQFALDVCLVAKEEGYPLDVLVGHMFAESACTPCMRPTPGSGAFGPLQVTAITCADVGMVYPPSTIQDALRAGVRYMRRCDRYGALNLTEALRMYGLGPGGAAAFKRDGCSGTPCARPQTVWRHECGCSGDSNRYTYKVGNMTRRAAAAGLHTRSWATWSGKS